MWRLRLDLRTVEARSVETDEVLDKEAFLHDFYFMRNKFHECVRRWAIRAAGMFRDIELLRELFVTRTDLFSRLTFKEAAAIQSRWGESTFRKVVGTAPEARHAAPVRVFHAGLPAA